MKFVIKGKERECEKVVTVDLEYDEEGNVDVKANGQYVFTLNSDGTTTYYGTNGIFSPPTI